MAYLGGWGYIEEQIARYDVGINVKLKHTKVANFIKLHFTIGWISGIIYNIIEYIGITYSIQNG